MKDLMGVMKQAQQLQERMQKLQEELAAMEIAGHSGGGLVTVTLNGKGAIRRVRIDPSLMRPDEAEIVEDLIVAAASDAKTKVEIRPAGEDAGADRRAADTSRAQAVLVARSAAGTPRYLSGASASSSLEAGCTARSLRRGIRTSTSSSGGSRKVIAIQKE